MILKKGFYVFKKPDMTVCRFVVTAVEEENPSGSLETEDGEEAAPPPPEGKRKVHQRRMRVADGKCLLR